MVDILSSIITNVLTALYQPFWFSILFSMVAMYMYLFIIDGESAGKGLKNSIITWYRYFKTSSRFRKIFCLVFYTSMILFRTLLNRNMWLNPLENVIGFWWIYVENPVTGEVKLTTECIENIILFIPFSALLMWCLEQKKNIRYIIWSSTKTVFLFSITIEFLQLFLRVGTFQLSDIFYNTLGGLVGGLIYWVISIINRRFS